MRRTGTRMSPSVRNTRSDAGSSGSGSRPFDRIDDRRQRSPAVPARRPLRSSFPPPALPTARRRSSCLRCSSCLAFLRRHYPDQVQGVAPTIRVGASQPADRTVRPAPPAIWESCLSRPNVNVAPHNCKGASAPDQFTYFLDGRSPPSMTPNRRRNRRAFGPRRAFAKNVRSVDHPPGAPRSSLGDPRRTAPPARASCPARW